MSVILTLNEVKGKNLTGLAGQILRSLCFLRMTFVMVALGGL